MFRLAVDLISLDLVIFLNYLKGRKHFFIYGYNSGIFLQYI